MVITADHVLGPRWRCYILDLFDGDLRTGRSYDRVFLPNRVAVTSLQLPEQVISLYQGPLAIMAEGMVIYPLSLQVSELSLVIEIVIWKGPSDAIFINQIVLTCVFIDFCALIVLRGLLVGASTHGLMLIMRAWPGCYLINGLGLDRAKGEKSNFSRHRVTIRLNRVNGLIFWMALRGTDRRRCIIAAIRTDIIDRGRPWQSFLCLAQDRFFCADFKYLW